MTLTELQDLLQIDLTDESTFERLKQAILDNHTNSGYSYVEVSITASDTTYSDGRPAFGSGITSMGGNPIVLLEDPTNDQYNEVHKIILEYTGGTTSYTTTEDYLRLYAGQEMALIGTLNTIAATKDSYYVYTGNDGVKNDAVLNYNFTDAFPPNRALTFRTFGATNPSGGDGSFLVKIWYKVRSFGSEL